MESEITERHYIKADPGWYLARYQPAEEEYGYTYTEGVSFDPIVVWEVRIDGTKRGQEEEIFNRYVTPITVEYTPASEGQWRAIKAPDGRFTAQEENTYDNEAEWVEAMRRRYAKLKEAEKAKWRPHEG
jgi:hypothetical protein